MTAWPVSLRGVTESIVTTPGPNGLYNVAALGIHAPGRLVPDVAGARTYGRTRTWRNFRERGEGVVQFTRDPVVFVDAALDVREQREPVLETADAWSEVSVDRVDEGTEDGTQWVDWALRPERAEVRREAVPVFNRGYAAVVEATVAASRLEVDAYDARQLEERLDYYDGVVERCGGPREREAFDRLDALR